MSSSIPSTTSTVPSLANTLTSGASTSTIFDTTSGASSSATSSSTSDSTDTSSLDSLSQQIQAMDLAQQQANIKTQDFQKTTNDLQVDNRMTARNVGTLQKNTSRLNIFSSLDKNDKADFFTFNVSTSGETKFSLLTNDKQNEAEIHVQILNQNGSVVADSDPSSGDKNKAYQQLTAGTLSLKTGKYVVRVTRQDDSQANQQKAYSYAMQLSQGLYKNDFDTIEKSVDPNADPYGLAANSSLDTLTSSLAGAVSDIQNLPPIGSSATDKLTGVLSNLTA